MKAICNICSCPVGGLECSESMGLWEARPRPDEASDETAGAGTGL